MSNAPTTPPNTSTIGAAAGLAPPPKRSITLVSHSAIFYWWPIWLLGFVMAAITYLEDHRLAIVPAGTHIHKTAEDPAKNTTTFEMTVANPLTRSLENAAKDSIDPTASRAVFKPRVSQKAWMGPVYCVVLILTILITNIPLRGLWSFLVLLLIAMLALIFTVFNVWDDLLGAIGNLHIYINMAGYLFIATTVLVLWLVSVFIFDQRTYMTVTPGQIQVCEHIGASIRNFDTTGMTFEKQRDDLFRHWILGFFSGDLIVRTSGAEREEIRLPNVLWIGWRLEEVQKILREKATVVHG